MWNVPVKYACAFKNTWCGSLKNGEKCVSKTNAIFLYCGANEANCFLVLFCSELWKVLLTPDHLAVIWNTLYYLYVVSLPKKPFSIWIFSCSVSQCPVFGICNKSYKLYTLPHDVMTQLCSRKNTMDRNFPTEFFYSFPDQY